MDLSARKLRLIEWLLSLQDIRQIERVESISSESRDFWEDLPTHAKESVKRGIKDADERRVYSTQEVKDRVKSKFGL